MKKDNVIIYGHNQKNRFTMIINTPSVHKNSDYKNDFFREEKVLSKPIMLRVNKIQQEFINPYNSLENKTPIKLRIPGITDKMTNPIPESTKKRKLDSELNDTCQKRPRIDYINFVNKTETKIENTSVDHYWKTAHDLAQSDEDDQALEVYGQALDLCENDATKADLLYERAVLLEKMDDFQGAVAEWKKLSKLPLGWRAFNALGSIYLYDRSGIEKDYDKALKYFTKGAEIQDVEAEYNIAVVYDNQRNETDDVDQCEEFRRLAIMQYEKIAQYRKDCFDGTDTALFNCTYLKHLDEEGSFSPLDLNKARTQYTKMDTLKNTDSRVPLMRAFVEYKINKDSKKVYEFLEKSKSLGNSVAEKILKLKDNPRLFNVNFQKHLEEPQQAYIS